MSQAITDFVAWAACMKVLRRCECNPYSARKVYRDSAGGFDISTAWTPDEGYETAILDTTGTYPVERYENKKLAQAGHEKWCAFVAGGSRDIICLGGLGGTVPDMPVTLVAAP